MEKVLVVPTALIETYLSEKSFITDNILAILEIIKKNHLFVDRDYAEYALEYKQIIPYAVLKNGSSFYLTQRLRKQTEKRLHGLYSIGLGGHINPEEELSEDVIIAGMRRELHEEVGFGDFEPGKCVGIINDHAAEVSNYHVGLVYLLLAPDNIQVCETSKMTGAWASEDEVSQRFDEMESWSKIVWESRDKWNI